MLFNIFKQSKLTEARIGKLKVGSKVTSTPFFMPCATLGAVKGGIEPEILQNLGYDVIICNTYHLFLRPRIDIIRKSGGLHKFIKWPGIIATDSGGFQVFSLGAGKKEFSRNDENAKPEVKLSQKGVEFKSHLDGSRYIFTPEKVIDIQLALDSDILMVLDVCTEFPATKKRAEETMNLTHLWAQKSAKYWQKLKKVGKTKNKALFGIVQGSIYRDLREKSAKFISSLDFDGIAVGGVSVGEGKQNMENVMKQVMPYLPKNKPRYLMGVGEPEDLIKAIKKGFDMFDCVLPTRLARHGVAWHTNSKFKIQSSKLQLKTKKLDLRKARFRNDLKPLQDDCQCPTCSQRYSRAYLSHLVREKEILGIRLLTLHNLYLIQELIKNLGNNV